MAPKISNNPQQPCCIKFLHEIGSGPSDMQQGYGILMAELCGFPNDVLAMARALRNTIQQEHVFAIH